MRRKEAGRGGVVLSAGMFPDFFCKDKKLDLQKKDIEKYNTAYIVYYKIMI